MTNFNIRNWNKNKVLVQISSTNVWMYILSSTQVYFTSVKSSPEVWTYETNKLRNIFHITKHSHISALSIVNYCKTGRAKKRDKWDPKTVAYNDKKSEFLSTKVCISKDFRNNQTHYTSFLIKLQCLNSKTLNNLYFFLKSYFYYF